MIVFAPAFRLDGKTSSMEAAACTVPAGHGTDLTTRERARSDELRSMFSVFECFFELLACRQVAGQKSSKTSSRTFFPTVSTVKLPRAVLTRPGWVRGAKGARQEGGWTVRALGLDVRRHPRRG